MKCVDNIEGREYHELKEDAKERKIMGNVQLKPVVRQLHQRRIFPLLFSSKIAVIFNKSTRIYGILM